MNKCIGCGSFLETDKNLCERCFRIRNYGDYQLIDVSNKVFLDILNSINLTDDLVVLVIDVFNFNNLNLIRKYLNNDILVVLTKRDLLPKRVSDDKLISYFDNCNLNYKDIVVISSNKNYNFDNLYGAINKYKKGKNVFVVGFTNAGKSTMINKIIYNYSDSQMSVTTSILPSTTLDSIYIKINDELTLIDTPGILDDRCLYNFIDGASLKKVVPKREIRPISYQVKGKQYIVVDKYCVLEVSNLNIVIFMSNALDIKRYYSDKLKYKYNSEVSVNNNDIVINGLGFIKCVGCGTIKVSCCYDILVYTRDSLI